MYSLITLCKFLKYTLNPLGDAAYQERVWIRHEGKEVDDYDEATMHFMDRCEEMLAHPNSYEGMNAEIQEILQELYDKVCKFDIEIAIKYPENEDHKVISTPEWHEIQSLASNAYKKITNSLKERNYGCE